MQLKAGMLRQPLGHAVVLVRPIIVQDQMRGQVGSKLSVQMTQKLQGLLVAMPGQTLADDRSLQHVERGEQRRRAIPL